MTILNIPTEFLNNIFQGLFGKKTPTKTVTLSPQKRIVPMSDEEYAAKAQKANIDFNDMYAYNLMM